MANRGLRATFKVNFNHIDKKPPATGGNNTFSWLRPQVLYFSNGGGVAHSHVKYMKTHPEPVMQTVPQVMSQDCSGTLLSRVCRSDDGLCHVYFRSIAFQHLAANDP